MCNRQESVPAKSECKTDSESESDSDSLAEECLQPDAKKFANQSTFDKPLAQEDALVALQPQHPI